MSKVFELYTKNKKGEDVDRVWFQSSNVKYCECIDYDNQLKTLIIVFSNGSQYKYKDVSVTQYLLFRDASSQGKALNEYIKSKGYEFEKMENADLATLDGELSFRENGGIFVFYDDGKFVMKDNKDITICERDVKLTEAAFNTVCSALEAVGKQLYNEGKNFIEDGENREDKPF